MSQPHRQYPPGLPRGSQGQFTAPHKRLTPVVGKVLHTAPGSICTYVFKWIYWQKNPPPTGSMHYQECTLWTLYSSTANSSSRPLSRPLRVPRSCKRKGFQAAPRPRGTSFPQVAPGLYQSPLPQDQPTHNCRPCRHQPTGLLRSACRFITQGQHAPNCLMTSTTLMYTLCSLPLMTMTSSADSLTYNVPLGLKSPFKRFSRGRNGHEMV